MVDAVSSQRAQLVELLWQLKQNFDQESDSKLRLVHFNTLLNDPVYRTEIITRAINSDNRKIRALGLKLQNANHDGILLHKRPPTTDATTRLTNPDIAETLHSQTPHRTHLAQSHWMYTWLGLAMVMLGVIGYFAYHPIHQLIAGKQVIKGALSGEHAWQADTTWILEGLVYLEEGASLTIEPGTRIEGRPGSALIVTRGATLFSRGQENAPVVFTSNQPEGSRAAGDWGGVVMLGSAPVNLADARIEGVPHGEPRGAFGGQDPGSSCGVMEYTRIEFAGFEVYANNELNGLTLGGCGSGTIIRHVQVHRALDDGIEVFGGTVDLKHIVITGAADDSLDWDLGWRGRVQFLAIQQHADVGDNAFEGDNQAGNPTATPLSEPVMYNVTLISPRSHQKYHRAMTLKAGSGGHFHNMIIEGFSGETIDLKGVETVNRIEAGELSFNSMMINRIGSRGVSYFDDESGANDDDGGFNEARYFQSSAVAAQFGTDPLLTRDATSPSHPDFAPTSRSPARNGASPIPQEEFWDEAANYLGAVRPGSVQNWTDGWTAYPLN